MVAAKDSSPTNTSANLSATSDTTLGCSNQTASTKRDSRRCSTDGGRCGNGETRHEGSSNGALPEIGERPATAPTCSDGNISMRPLVPEASTQAVVDPPSLVFESGFSRLRTRRMILDRSDWRGIASLSCFIQAVPGYVPELCTCPWIPLRAQTRFLS